MTEVEKEIREQQKSNPKKMNTREKADYLWSYYKWYLIGAILAVVIVCTLIRDISYGSKPSYINAVIMNADPSFDPADRLVPDLMDFAGVDPKKYRINIDTSMYISEAPETAQITMGSEQKLAALYAAGEIDVMIAPESVFEHYPEADLFKDPFTILEADYIERLREKGFLPYYKKENAPDTKENSGNENAGKKDGEKCLGIIVNNSSYLNEIGIYYDSYLKENSPVIYSFSSISDDIKSSVNLLKLLTGVQ